MITITFDKGTQLERSIQLQNIYEYPLKHNFRGSNYIEIKSSEDFPDYSDFINNRSFSTIEAKDGNITIPLYCEYNCISDFTCNYISETCILDINISVGYEESEE